MNNNNGNNNNDKNMRCSQFELTKGGQGRGLDASPLQERSWTRLPRSAEGDAQRPLHSSLRVFLRLLLASRRKKKENRTLIKALFPKSTSLACHKNKITAWFWEIPRLKLTKGLGGGSRKCDAYCVMGKCNSFKVNGYNYLFHHTLGCNTLCLPSMQRIAQKVKYWHLLVNTVTTGHAVLVSSVEIGNFCPAGEINMCFINKKNKLTHWNDGGIVWTHFYKRIKNYFNIVMVVLEMYDV